MKTAIKYFFIYLGLTFLGALVFAFPAMIIEAIISKGFMADEANLSPWTISFLVIGGQILPLIVFWKKKWCNYAFFKGYDYKKLILWLVVGWIGCVLIEAFLQEYLPHYEWDFEVLKDIEAMLTNPIGIVSVCILAPLVEEGVFRGAIERKLLEKDWNPWWAIVISALLFALMHMNLTQGITAMILGLFLGWIYYRTRNIWLCIFVHALNNTVSTVLFYFTGNADASVGDTFSLPVNLLLLVLGGVLIFWGTLNMAKTEESDKQLTA